jgi:hypothetical protein
VISLNVTTLKVLLGRLWRSHSHSCNCKFLLCCVLIGLPAKLKAFRLKTITMTQFNFKSNITACSSKLEASSHDQSKGLIYWQDSVKLAVGTLRLGRQAVGNYSAGPCQTQSSGHWASSHNVLMFNQSQVPRADLPVPADDWLAADKHPRKIGLIDVFTQVNTKAVNHHDATVAGLVQLG